MNHWWRILLLSLAFFSSTSCRKDPMIPVKTKAELNAKMQEQLEKHKLTSLAYAVVKNGQLLYSNALGYADESTRRAATDTTRYLIASVSKTITAVALMQLVEQNRIALDDDINGQLPFSVRNPDFPDVPITYRMLLTHTSSISDDYQNTLDLYCYGSDCAKTLDQFFKDVFLPGGAYNDADNFSRERPGTKEDYSNLASALVGYLVERISQTPFDGYCRDHIFIPLGMHKTEWRLANSPVAELAVPYSKDLTQSSPHYTFPDYPNGGLRTTVRDLSVFLRAIIQNGTYNSIPILSQASTTEMKTLQNGSTEQCLSFYYETINAKKYLGHSGGEMGVTTEMYFDPQTNIGVIVFNNDDDAELADIISYLFNFGENQ